MLEILPSRIAIIRESLGNLVNDIVTTSVAYNSFKLKVVLSDRSSLRIQENYAKGELGGYAYYWLDSGNKLIIGWDNVPHHTDLPNFPHHKHVGTQVDPLSSAETTLEQILTLIKQRIIAA